MYKMGFCQKEYMTWANAIEFASKHNFQHVELECEFIGRNEKKEEEYISEIINLAQEKNITLSLHCVNGINLAEKVYCIRQSSIEIMKRSIELAHQLGALWITTHLGVTGSINRDKYERKMEFICDALHELDCDSGKININIENLQQLNMEREKHYFGSEISELLYIKRRIPDSKLHFTLDVGHININSTKEKINEMIDLMAPNITAVHIHSNNGRDDQHFAFVSGVMNEWILHKYKKLLLQKYLLIECYSLRDIIVSRNKILEIMKGE